MYTHNKYPRYYDSDALQKLTPRLAGWWPTQKPYKNHFLFQKECGQPYNFCREANKVGQTNCACTYNLTIPIINNIKKTFDSN